jgi:hypothetical protein
LWLTKLFSKTYRVVNTALQLAFVSTCLAAWVRIRWIQWADGAAIRAIYRIEEVVQETIENVVGLINWIVCLEQDTVLRVDERIRDLKV